MDELIQYLMSFAPETASAQYTRGGNWEQAIKVGLENPVNLTSENNIDATVAVEVFYRLNDSRMIFLGLRYSEDLKLVSEPRQFLASTLKVVSQAKKYSLRELVQQLGTVLNDDPTTYASKTIQYVELGVERFWKSEGPLVLRKADDLKLEQTSLHELLQPYGHLIENSKNNIALEFAVDKPEAWIGVQVSEQIDGKFRTNMESLLTLSNLI